MPEKIIDKNILTQSNEDLTTYAIYVCRERSLPSPLDGLKPVSRKILYAMYDLFKETRRGEPVKSARIVGAVMQFHPHSDAGIYGAFKSMVNWFESYVPLILQQGSFGNIWGDSAAASRYTYAALTKYAVDEIIGDMNETYASTDWQWNFDGTTKEPVYLPSKVPNLLINGNFGIAVGLRTQIPKHNINEVIDATIHLIDHPNADVILVPDDPQGSDIIETDFAKLSHTGIGKFKTRAIIEIGEFHHKPALFVKTLPSMVFFKSIKEKIEQLKENNILPQVIDIYNDTKIPDFKSVNGGNKENFNVIIVLKKGSDPNYVKELLYSSTQLEQTIAVNFEVVYNDTPVVWNYKEYLQHFIQFRIERKARMFNTRLKECKTKMHELQLYIYALESGKIDEIVDLIRKQNTKDDNTLIESMIKLLPKITPLQAKFLLNTNVKKLSLGYLKECKANFKELSKQADFYLDYSIHTEKLKEIIKDELREAKHKYGCPRRSKIISKAEVSGIPEGRFIIAITENGFVKKVDEHDTSSMGIRNDRIMFIITIDNTDNLIVFSKLGKVFKIPVHKIPFSSRGSNGIDLRMILKSYVGEGIAAILSESDISNIYKNFTNSGLECNLFVVTVQGLFKRMNISEILNVPLSGLIYSRLNEGDIISDVIIMNPMNELIIYSRNKVLKMQGIQAPLLNRATKGNIAMSSKYGISGVICIIPADEFIIAVTMKGKVNKVPLSIIPLSERGKSGLSVIKIDKSDDIRLIVVCTGKDSIIANTTTKGKVEIPVSTIKCGSSISTGVKLINSTGVIDVYIKKN